MRELDDETWFPTGRGDYMVTETGRIRRTSGWKVQGPEAATYQDEYGRIIVHVYINKALYELPLDQLMAEAFLNLPPREDHVIVHLDGDPLNCRVDNISWG